MAHTIVNTKSQLHDYFRDVEEHYAHELEEKEECRAASAARDRAEQHALWSRYFRRFPASDRNAEVG